MRVLVCGSRDFSDQEYVNSMLNEFSAKHGPITVVIDGMATGADSCGFTWAYLHKIATDRYPAEWNKYGKRAGYLRNQRMLDEGKPDVVLAFSSKSLPDSRGTHMMCKIAHTASVPVYVMGHDNFKFTDAHL